MSVLLTRPLDDSRRLASALAERGYEVLIDPVLEIDLLTPSPPPRDRYQAVIVTSRHAVHALADVPAELPVFCVGEATAERVRLGGRTQVSTGTGDGLGLAEAIVTTLDPRDGPLLHLAGAEIRTEPGDLLRAHGFQVERVLTYRARPASRLHPGTIEALDNRQIRQVLLFSPRTASLFTALSGTLDLGGCDALCLSANVAAAVDPARLARVLVATQPDEKALLDLLEAPGHR